MKVLITGGNGQLGSDLCKTLNNVEVIPLTHADIEITDIDSVKKSCNRYKPDIIINTAAYVRVDDCEDNPDKAFRVNALGARNVAVVAQELGAKFVHISTDYVFGGSNSSPLDSRSNLLSGYTEFDKPSPINIYGKSKLAGEEFIRHLCTKYFIIRGSGLFGAAGSSGKGGNFVETMLRLGKERPELKVVGDQVFSPTYTLDLAVKISQIIETEYYGIFHMTNSGTCSWYEFTREILKQTGLKTPVIPITFDQYPQKAERPRYSVLRNYQLHLLGMTAMRPWQEGLKEYLKEKRYLK